MQHRLAISASPKTGKNREEKKGEGGGFCLLEGREQIGNTGPRQHLVALKRKCHHSTTDKRGKKKIIS